MGTIQQSLTWQTRILTLKGIILRADAAMLRRRGTFIQCQELTFCITRSTKISI